MLAIDWREVVSNLDDAQGSHFHNRIQLFVIWRKIKVGYYPTFIAVHAIHVPLV